MNKKIIYSLIFVIGVVVNLYNFTDVFGDTAIPKARIFGTSTIFADSTNYVTLNKGFYSSDSIKTDKDLIVKGAVVLDTNRDNRVYVSGQSLQIDNNKENGSQSYFIGNKNSNYVWNKTSGGSGVQLMTLDTISGLSVLYKGLYASSTSGYIRFPNETTTQRDAITPAAGMVIFNTTTNKLQVYAGGTWVDLH